VAYCGNCGNSFEPGALIDGRCPACGAKISSTGNVVALDQLATQPIRGPFPPLPMRDPLPPPLPRAEDDPMAPPAAAAPERVMVRVDPHNVVVLDQRTSRGPNLILTLLVLAALLLLIGVAALARVPWNPLQLAIPASTATTNATVVSTVSTKVATTGATTGATTVSTRVAATVSTTAAPAGTSTASSGSPAVATATPLATATPGGPPALSVAPTQFSQLACLGPLGASVSFQVLNSGGGSLDWMASASASSYQVSPTSGSLAHNEQQTVTVNNILFSGHITITANGANNSPQTVTISCTV